VDLRLKTGLESLEATPDRRWSIRAAGESHLADAVVLATDFKQTRTLLNTLPASPEEHAQLNAAFEALVPAPITTIHLWFDRDVTGMDHAVLLDTRIQWLFTKSRIRRWGSERGGYCELVISASWPELQMGREEILSSALAEFELFFPAAKQAKLIKTGVLKEARATFSVTPGLDRYRLPHATCWPGLFLAGDWTQTEWPSTMEGAVRSGRLAAGAVMGDRKRFMAPELPATGLMKFV
jgi:zeta-carotene desaturase